MRGGGGGGGRRRGTEQERRRERRSRGPGHGKRRHVNLKWGNREGGREDGRKGGREVGAPSSYLPYLHHIITVFHILCFIFRM